LRPSAVRARNRNAPSEPVVAASRLPRLSSLAGVRRAVDQNAPRPGAALALSSQPAARFERDKQRRPHPETFSEDKS
jgi:hypothetical protein